MQTKEKIPILAVVGPTASGKTALGVELAKAYNGEVVSVDSMQIYKGMDIATAKPTPEEMQGIPHHLIDILPRDTIFNVADYVKLAEQAIADITQRGKLPILVGGTGLYLASLLDNVQFVFLVFLHFSTGFLFFPERIVSTSNNQLGQECFSIFLFG